MSENQNLPSIVEERSPGLILAVLIIQFAFIGVMHYFNNERVTKLENELKAPSPAPELRTPKTPKFKIGQRVCVINGAHCGHEAIVLQISKLPDGYFVELVGPNQKESCEFVREYQLSRSALAGPDNSIVWKE